MNHPSQSLGRLAGAAAVLLLAGTVSTAKVPEPARSPDVAGGARPTIGVVEEIRRVEHGDGEAASFEFTVRLRDGTTRTSQSASAYKWRSGDRIMLIGGASSTVATH
jgi:hypothetical protein